MAMAAAAGLADVGIGLDHLSGPRVGAAALHSLKFGVERFEHSTNQAEDVHSREALAG